MLKILSKILNFLLHVPAIFLIYYFWQPISSWYLSRVPALGVDLYLSATYVSYQLKQFSLPFNSFKDFWFGGNPLLRDYPQLTFYLMIPFARVFGPVVGVQKFTMFALLFLVVVCYFLFYKLSKNHGVAILLAVLVLLSPNIYGAATWAGSIPYFFAQAFFPLGLLAGVLYLEAPKVRYLALMALVTGIGFLVNGFAIVVFLIPSMFLVILFGGFVNRLSIKKIILHFALYNFSWLFASFTVTYQQFLILVRNFGLPSLPSRGLDTGASAAASAGSSDIAQFYKSQINLLFVRTDHLIFIALGVGVVLFLISAVFYKDKRKLLLFVPVVLITAWTFIHPIINFAGIYNILRHDPYRAFWPAVIATSTLAAFLIGYLFRATYERARAKKYFFISFVFVNIVLSVGIAIFAYTVFRQKVDRTIEVLAANSEFSSAFPESLSIRFKKEESEKLASELVPSFMDPNDRNTRLYDADATVNIWWNTLFNMPLSRGYIDPPIGTQSRGGFFWLDIAIANDTLVRDFKLSEETALANTLFLIDWNAIGFFEGGRLSSKGPAVGPSTYLVNNQVFDKEEETTSFGAVLKYGTASGKPELVPNLPQKLHYYKVADNFRSPILYPTNAAAVVVVTSDPQYEDMMRIIATKNLNSRKIIPARVDYIDDLTLAKLKAFDAVILQNYVYKNREKAFNLLEKYIREGGKVFIDTGQEVRESTAQNLPEIFPFDASVRKSFGREWKLAGDSEFLKDINLANFGPLIFDDSDWKLTTPIGNLRDGSKVLLSHDGKPILVERSIGGGKVIWSGMNLSYHFNQYKSQDEANMFIKILSDFTNLGERAPLPAQTHWIANEKVTIETEAQPRGIMFKEQAYDGWTAKLDGRRLPIYKTGPTFPGFMYIPLANLSSGPVKVEFKYNGIFGYWLVAFVNLLAVLILIDLIILNGTINNFVIRYSRKILGVRIIKWWQKEDE